jgi:hypothetical protein
MKKHVSCLLVGAMSLLSFIPTEVKAAELKSAEAGQEGSSSVMSPPDERHAKDELRWRDQLSTAKAQRSGLLIVGIGGAVAGTVVLVKGVTEFNEAGKTPGCSRNGNEILCNDESSRASAQDKLDSGRSKMAIGLVVMGIGAGLSVWGVARGNEVSRLERVGKKKGYKVDVTTQGTDGMAVMLSRSF